MDGEFGRSAISPICMEGKFCRSTISRSKYILRGSSRSPLYHGVNIYIEREFSRSALSRSKYILRGRSSISRSHGVNIYGG